MPITLHSATEIESQIEETGGVPVSIGGVSTHGHVDQLEDAGISFGAALEAEAPVPRDVVRVAAGVLASDPSSGDAITVDGQSLQVIDHVEVEDEAITALVVGSWTHTVDTYRPSTASEIPRVSGQQQLQFDATHLSGVSCDLMALSGEIRAERSGDRASVEYEGRFPPGTDLQPGDYVKVTAGEGPTRFRVTFVGDRTSRWPTRVELEESDESF